MLVSIYSPTNVYYYVLNTEKFHVYKTAENPRGGHL